LKDLCFRRADESNVVKFPFSVAAQRGMVSIHRRHRVEREARVREIGGVELTETAKNSRLRDARKNAWHEAQTRVEYFHRRMEFDCVVKQMQDMGLPEGNLHPVPMDRAEAVRLWRAALVAQFLLPAPNGGDVAWKKTRLAIRSSAFVVAPISGTQRAPTSKGPYITRQGSTDYDSNPDPHQSLSLAAIGLR
jgi:hypothetical protein